MGWFTTKKKEVIPSTMHNLLVQSFGQVRKDVQNVYDWLKFLYNQNTFQQRLLEDQRKEIQELRSQMALMPQNKEEVRALIDAYYDITPVLNQVQEMERRIVEVANHRQPHISVEQVAEQVKDQLNEEVTSHFESAESRIQRQVESRLREELQEAVSARLEAVSDRLEARQEPESEAISALNERLEKIQEQLTFLGEKQAAPVPAPATYVQQVQPAMPSVPRQNSALKEKLMRSLTRNSKEYIKNTIMGLIKKYQKITGLQLREIVVEEQGLVSRSSFYRLLNELEHEQSGLSVIQHGKEKIYVVQQPVEGVTAPGLPEN